MFTTLICLFLTQLLGTSLIVCKLDVIFRLLLARVGAGAAELPFSLTRRAVVPLALSFIISALLLLETTLLQPAPWILLLRAGVLGLGNEFLFVASVSLALPLIVIGVALSPIIVMLLLILVHKLKLIFAFLIMALFGPRM